MNTPEDFFSFSVYPKTRQDLIIVPQKVRGIQTYMIKDPVNQAYHRVGEMEHVILNLLDGQNSFSQILEGFQDKTGGSILDSNDLEDALKWFKKVDLLEKPRTEKSILFYQKMREKRKRKLRGRLGLKNILELSLPAFDPDKFFDKIIHPLRFFWSRAFLIFSFFCLFFVVLIAASNWQSFKEASFGLYSFHGKGVTDYVLIYVVFFVIVAIHECAHGLTCKYYGGEVHQLGFILYYFQPCFYCQVDDAYLFKNKYQRIAVMTAGPYSELLICCFAVFLWWLTPPHIFLHLLSAYVLAITGLVAVVFNFNPLMKYDGYYILSDYLEALNLREESFKYIRNWLKNNILKTQAESVDIPPRLKKIYGIYGVSALLYTGFVLTIVFFMAKNFLVSHYHIWGVLIIVTLAFLLIRKRVKKLWNVSKEFERNRRLFLYIRNRPVPFLLLFLVLFYGLFFLKINWEVKRDFIIEPEEKVEVRSVNEGFVREVLVKEGDEVVPNQLLAIVQNDSLQNRIFGLHGELAIITQRIREDYLANDVLLVETGVNEKRRLENELKEAQRKMEKLKLTAPMSGTVLTPRMEEKKGVFICTGEIICELADLSQLEARIHLPPWDMGDVKENDRVELKISSHARPLEGMIVQLSLTPEESHLSCYQARVKIKKPEKTLKPGMTGRAKIICGQVSLVGYLYRKIFRSLRTELWK